MKKYILFLLLSVMAIGCSKNDATSQSELLKQAIQGKWQLTSQAFFDPENPNNPHLVVNGHFLFFNPDQSFVEKSYDNQIVISGNYSIDNNGIIHLRYSDASNSTFVKKITKLDLTTLHLSDDLTSDGSACFEGCADIYTKRPND
jgi:hypothetical protein